MGYFLLEITSEVGNHCWSGQSLLEWAVTIGVGESLVEWGITVGASHDDCNQLWFQHVANQFTIMDNEHSHRRLLADTEHLWALS